MKVGLNATCLNHRPSGARQRFFGIYGNLVSILPSVEFILYEPADCRISDSFVCTPNVTPVRTSISSKGRVRKFLSGFGYWNDVFKADSFNVFECFNQPLIKCSTGYTVSTIHGIWRTRTDYGFAEREMYILALRRTLAIADHVITFSESMKSEILAFNPDAQVSAIYNGLDYNSYSAVSASDVNKTREKYGLPHTFLLSVGHFERRKNYCRLLDAVALLRDSGNVYHLLIVGNDSGYRHALEVKINDLNLSSQVMLLSGVSDLELRCLFKLTSLFVFPSSYEGFGIPILEAMASGVPSVLSDIPVFREITENLGVYFPYYDVEAMAAAISSTLASRVQRDFLVAYGQHRVKDFGFDVLSTQVATLYSHFYP